MKIVLLSILVILSVNSHAMDVGCEGWYQLPGQVIEKSEMSIISNTADSIIYQAEYKDYKYRVDWNFYLTVFYTTINYHGNRLLFTTARVPTENHRDSFTDITLPNGLRLAVNCEVK